MIRTVCQVILTVIGAFLIACGVIAIQDAWSNDLLAILLAFVGVAWLMLCGAAIDRRRDRR